MKFADLHSWDLTPAEAIALQEELAERVDTQTPLQHCDLVAGADIAYEKDSDLLHAGVVVLRMNDGSIVERRSVSRRGTFPYVPGLFSFREAPPLLEAFAQLESEPDVIMCDAQGMAHPRRFGLTCHLGLWLERPCIGCAKSRFIGTFGELGEEAGAQVPLLDGDEVIGSVVRTRAGIKPVYVSVGHKIDLPSAVRIVLASTRGYRIPEPTRQAHLFVNEVRRAALA